MQGKLIGFKLVGGHYKNGFRYPGFMHLTIESNGEQKTIYRSEDVSLKQACEDLNKQGYDTSIIDEWVKTGGVIK